MTAIPVTAAGGVELTGLTPGVTYTVYTAGGPWYPTGNSALAGAYGCALSPDNVTWTPPMGTSLDPWSNLLGSPLSDSYVPSWALSRQNLDAVHVMVTFNALTHSLWVRVGDNPANFGDNTGTLSAEIGPGTLPFCQYGTSPQGAVTGGIIITTALIDLLVAFVEWPAAVAVIFDAFVGKTLWAGDICSGTPPLMPNFTNSDFIGTSGVPNPASIAKWWQGLEAAAWQYFCQCNAGPLGAPPPLAPPVPTLVLPPAAPPGPIAIGCDESDLCTSLNALARQLSAMSGQIAQLRSDLTLVQRQSTPFAYVPGTLHTGLTDAGQFAVQGILGLAVQVTTVPGASGEIAGDPIARFGLGYITTGTPDGWRRSVPIRANPMWVDVQPDDTLVGYSFEPLVVANIQEFRREP